MKENKRKARRGAAKGITAKNTSNAGPRRRVDTGDIAIPKKGVWAGEHCLVLYVEKRPQPNGHYQVLRVLLPNGMQRWFPLSEIKEIIHAKRPVPSPVLLKDRDVKATNEKVNMKVVLRHVSGSAEANLERAKAELARVLD